MTKYSIYLYCSAQKVSSKSDQAKANTKMSFTGRDSLLVFAHWEEIVSVTMANDAKARQNRYMIVQISKL